MSFRHLAIAAGFATTAFLAGNARADIEITGTVFEDAYRTPPKEDCELSGGTWVVPSSGDPYCELVREEPKDDGASTWAPDTDAGSSLAVGRADGARKFFAKLVAAPKVASKPLLRETGAWLAVADKLLARWAKANEADSLKKDPASVKRVANRKKTINAWALLRADVVKLEAEIKRRLAEQKPKK